MPSTQNLSPLEESTLHYYWGNGFSHLADSHNRWSWENEELEQAIFHYRMALTFDGISAMPDLTTCQLYTNLANSLSTIGRFIEAIGYYNSALAIDPSFVMARGNKGLCMHSYGEIQFDGTFQQAISRSAYFEFAAATHLESRRFDVQPQFASYLEYIESEYGILAPHTDLADEDRFADLPPLPRAYRRWALENKLYINPMNDLGSYGIAADDLFHITPKFEILDDKHTTLLEFVSQIKQEFASARYLLYSGVELGVVHHSDNETYTMEISESLLLDYRIEQIKASLRTSYSIFDKIGFFLNYYFGLGIDEHEVSFSGIWYENSRNRDNLRPEFRQQQNWPLRGLFWLSKDLIYDNTMHAETSLEPGARELARLRNQVEHRYVQTYSLSSESNITDSYGDYNNELAYQIPRERLVELSLQMLQKVRAAIIYFILGLNKKELQREHDLLH